MQVGIFTSGYQRSDVEDIFRDAKRFGYDYIELWGGRPHAYAYDLKRGQTDKLLSLRDKYEIPIKVYTPEHNAYPYNYMIGDEYQRKESIEYLKTAIEMGKALGAEYTVISAGHAGYEATRKEIWERLCKSIRELVDYAQEKGHMLLIEALTPYESNVCTTANDLCDIIEYIDSTYFGAMCDIVPAFVQQESIMSYFKKLGKNLKHLHIIDSDGSSDTHLMPGDGSIPLKELMEEIRGYGYNEGATIELVTAYINEPSLYAKKAIDRLKKITER
ncbi:fructoselysine 3-epimerase [Sedimentibacter hydroxybenzoicus DSM 7310]|uniref:Fructoselysine 3-epimerase n=1 Tax=Sedimentibacter hydroxybenzoicus DSM 7310 TaxID=1123245 RepID=A0A974GVG8_SEDHY|nr:fructoselysine 3-epimerase [Sedimentibacter hydroxybenzoicus]NYB73358.1 fructoselysine 3-epimerase [Sedimentibacter hydroxybenzoicus DSM 7310]